MALTTTITNEIQACLHPTSGTKTLGTKTITAPIRARLIVNTGSISTAGTELSTSGSYVAVTGISIGANWGTIANGAVSNNALITQTGMPNATTLGVELWDSSGTPIRIELGTFGSPKITISGDTLSFTSGSITSTLA